MNIKLSLFYAALAGCLGTGYVGGKVITQRDMDNVGQQIGYMARCGPTDDDKRFNATSPRNSPPKGYAP